MDFWTQKYCRGAQKWQIGKRKKREKDWEKRMKKIKLTMHSKRRMKSRLKMSDEKDIYKFVLDALELGVCQSEITNKELSDFISKRDHQNRKFIIYCGYVLIFTKYTNTLITIYEIPKEILWVGKIIDKLLLY